MKSPTHFTQCLCTILLLTGGALCGETPSPTRIRALSLETPAGDIHVGMKEDALLLPTHVYRLSSAIEVAAGQPLRFYRKTQGDGQTQWEFVGEIDREAHPGNAFTILFAPADRGQTRMIVLADEHPDFGTHQMRVINASGQDLRTRDNGTIRPLPGPEPVFFRFDMGPAESAARSRPFLTFERLNDSGEWEVFTRGPLLRQPGERLTILIVHSSALNAALQINNGEGRPATPSPSLHIISWREP